MKITDEEIEKEFQYAEDKGKFITGAKWCRERYEREKSTQELPENVIYNGEIVPVQHICVGRKKNCTWLSVDEFNNLTHDEKLQEGKEIPWKPITEQAYDGSTINRNHEDPADWRGVDMGKLWNVSFSNGKRRIRELALDIAKRGSTDRVTILQDAEKIYEWLIKG